MILDNLLFLFIFFSFGYVFGLLLKNPTGPKFLLFGFVGILIYQPIKDAGIVASAFFVFGVIFHHLSLTVGFDFVDLLYRFFPKNRGSTFYEGDKNDDGEGGQSTDKESPDETRKKYEDYVHHSRGYTSREEEYRKKSSDQKAGGSKRKTEGKSKSKADVEAERLRKERERLKAEEDRLKAEREAFEKSQRPPPDNRTDEEVLGLVGDYTLADLKKARNEQVKRWNTSNMVNKPPHLVKMAEEEAKRINIAYEALKSELLREKG